VKSGFVPAPVRKALAIQHRSRGSSLNEHASCLPGKGRNISKGVNVDVTIKKVGQRDGKDRFILVNATTRKVLTVDDVSEASLRRFFRGRGVPDETMAEALATAQERYAQAAEAKQARVDEAADTLDDDDLLFELGFGENDAEDEV
jgi:hypothetical protein